MLSQCLAACTAMAPSKDICTICNSAFFGRQKFLKCAGPCGLRFHLDCLNIGEAEYDIFMQSGSSTYKCRKCLSVLKSSQGDNTPVRSNQPGEKKVISPTRELVLPNFPSSYDGLAVQLETVRLNSVSLLDMVSDILAYVKNLEKDMNELKSENLVLKEQLSELLSKGGCPLIPNQIKSTNSVRSNDPIKKSYSKVVSENRAADNQHNCNSDASATRKSASTTPRVTVSHNNIELNQANASTSANDSEGFQLVSRKKYKKREPKVGTLASSNIEMAPERIKTKSLFVSRFSSKVSTSNIEDSLKNQLQLRSLAVTKLKTKYQSYSSFHITVDVRDFDSINNPEVWPAGCLIAPFYGKLKPEQHFTHAANSNSVDSQGNAS